MTTFNPQVESAYWNYSNSSKEGYSTSLIGTVLAMQFVQKTTFNPNGPGQPEFWNNGDPKMNIRLALATKEGQLKLFEFAPASKAAREGKKLSVHIELFRLTNNTDMKNLIGKTIGIYTEEGQYGLGNPRPWSVDLVEEGPYELNAPLPDEFKVERVLTDTAVSGGQVQTPQQQVVYQQPQPVQQPAQQVVYQQPQPVQQPAQQVVYQQPQPQAPAVDQQIMDAMQPLGVNPNDVQVTQVGRQY